MSSTIHKHRFRVLGLIAGAGLGTLALGLAPSAQADEVVTVAVARVFVPEGFDSNDEVQVVLDGQVPTSCYQLLSPTVTVNHDARTVNIAQKAILHQGSCLTARVPFSTVARFGPIAEGSYQVKVSQNPTAKPLQVKQAQEPLTDEYFYAPVDNVYLPEDDGGAAILQGRFTTSCMKITRTKLRDQGDTLVLLPIMDKNSLGENCRDEDRLFNFKVNLPEKSRGRYLLHVRSLNGQAVNHVYSVLSSPAE